MEMKNTPSVHSFERIGAEIAATKLQIKAALWKDPADVDRARLLVSKLVGLQINAGERHVKLRTPADAMKRQGASAAALLGT